MITQKHIDNFSKTLKVILDEEIKLGNHIAETSKGWSQDDTVIVFLDKPFKKQYHIENIEYRIIDDPHYWKAEYYDSSKNHVLACKF